MLVTHDVLDAAVLADRIVVIDRGAVVDEGPTTRVLSAPRSPFSAHIAGVNLLVGDVVGSGEGTVTMRSGDGVLVTGVADAGLATGAAAAAVFRPVSGGGVPGRGLRVTAQPLAGHGHRAGAGRRRGQGAHLAGSGRRPHPGGHRRTRAGTGGPVHLAVKATEIRIHPH